MTRLRLLGNNTPISYADPTFAAHLHLSAVREAKSRYMQFRQYEQSPALLLVFLSAVLVCRVSEAPDFLCCWVVYKTRWEALNVPRNGFWARGAATCVPPGADPRALGRQALLTCRCGVNQRSWMLWGKFSCKRRDAGPVCLFKSSYMLLG